MMSKNTVCKILIIFLLVLTGIFLLFFSHSAETLRVLQINSPNEIVLSNGKAFSFSEYETFDSFYSQNNKKLAAKFNITEDEAFILGNLGKYWAKNILISRSVRNFEEDLVYNKFSYRIRFENSPYCIKDGKTVNENSFQKQIDTIRKGQFVIVDLDSDIIYPISQKNAANIKNYIVVRRSHVKKNITEQNFSVKENFSDLPLKYSKIFEDKNVKIILSDSTTKLIPDRNCSDDICQEILKNINNAQETIDLAIYGYSSTPKIESAIINAKKRGVKIRLVYDIDSKGNNIYPDTEKFVKLIPNNRSDKNSSEVGKTMHNKFYIFDNKIVITGSANLSHTDMSGYNSNAVIVIKSPEAAKSYKDEFEQMYSGKFHNDKVSNEKPDIADLKIFFSPQDKGIANSILPIIAKSEKYIYIPSFVITESRMTEALIKAQKRGVDVKIIVDALNASTQHSKHKILRQSGIKVKAENYAGKMHSKTIIVDDKYLIIGSMNFSNSGENKNDENFIIYTNEAAAKFYRNFFLYQWSRIPDKWLNKIPRAEGKDSIGSCTDGLDNNYDGYTDSKDDACKK